MQFNTSNYPSHIQELHWFSCAAAKWDWKWHWEAHLECFIIHNTFKPIGKCLKHRNVSQEVSETSWKKEFIRNNLLQLLFSKMCLLHLFLSWPESSPQWFLAVRLQCPDTGLGTGWRTFVSFFRLCSKWMCFLPNYLKFTCRFEFFISTNIIYFYC